MNTHEDFKSQNASKINKQITSITIERGNRGLMNDEMHATCCKTLNHNALMQQRIVKLQTTIRRCNVCFKNPHAYS